MREEVRARVHVDVVIAEPGVEVGRGEAGGGEEGYEGGGGGGGRKVEGPGFC